MATAKATKAPQSGAPEDTKGQETEQAAQSSQDEKNPEPQASAAPAPDAPASDPAPAQGEGQQPPATNGPAQKDDAEELFSLETLEAEFRVASWQQSALMRFMGWEPGKMVTRAEYEAALDSLTNRRQGGGRRA